MKQSHRVAGTYHLKIFQNTPNLIPFMFRKLRRFFITALGDQDLSHGVDLS